MKKILLATSLIILSLSNNFVLAATISEASLNKLLQLSGLNKQVAEIPALVEMGMEQARQQASTISEAEFSEMKSSLANAFKPSEILNAIGTEIKVSTSESDAKDLFKWYESDLARRITKAEEDSSAPAEYQKMIKTAQSLLADKKRVKFAKKLDGLLNLTDMSMLLQQNAAVASFIAVSTANEPNKPLNIEQIKSQLDKQLQQGRANIEQLVILSMVYSYKDIEMADLEKYGTFLKSPNARRFNDGTKKGLITALNQSINTMSKSLAANIKKQKSGI